MSEKRLSPKDIQIYLRTLLSDQGPTVKYQNPTAWRGNTYYGLI